MSAKDKPRGRGVKASENRPHTHARRRSRLLVGVPGSTLDLKTQQVIAAEQEHRISLQAAVAPADDRRLPALAGVSLCGRLGGAVVAGGDGGAVVVFVAPASFAVFAEASLAFPRALFGEGALDQAVLPARSRPSLSCGGPLLGDLPVL